MKRSGCEPTQAAGRPGCASLLRLEVQATPELLGRRLAAQILRGLQAAQAEGRPFLLGCPGGRSLRSTYGALAELAHESAADLSGLVVVMMDEYVQPVGSGFRYCPEEAHYSCRRFARVEIMERLNAGRPEASRVRFENLWFPDPVRPREYDERIGDAGGIDLFLLAAGASDGHVAFNPPGSGVDGLTRVVELAESTRRDNLQTFPDFQGLEEVPFHGVSVGLGTIARHSRSAVMVLHGRAKRWAVARLLALKGFEPAFPASLLFACREARLLVDEAARSTEEVF